MAPPYSENVAQIYLYNVYKTTAELTEKQKITVCEASKTRNQLWPRCIIMYNDTLATWSSSQSTVRYEAMCNYDEFTIGKFFVVAHTKLFKNDSVKACLMA